MTLDDLTAEQRGDIELIGKYRMQGRGRRLDTVHQPGEVLADMDRDRLYVFDGRGRRQRLRYLTPRVARLLAGL